MSMSMNWRREPFYGGCHYVADSLHVSGYYSPSNPTQYESDCTYWTASNVRGAGITHFATAAEAMAAAEDVLAILGVLRGLERRIKEPQEEQQQ
jgi:hypothetical protein